ncbi:hypothetical protein H5410_061386 [Solanum commersonii]|uniref:Uncharacterized protein n=1 Tax=Solanum commersonii TaxID=4109 RepID=A0A9J5W8Q6_SOLCO|nr:hypothetical protein H5410_061386 [Solanum commersonii]
MGKRSWENSITADRSATLVAIADRLGVSPFFLFIAFCTLPSACLCPASLGDSSCDTPIPKIFMLTILATNASSGSTTVSKWPHTKNDSIFTHRGLPLFSNQPSVRLTQDQKGLFKACNGAECKGFIKRPPKKGKAQGVFKIVSHAHWWATKKVYAKLANTLKSCLRSVQEHTLLNQSN